MDEEDVGERACNDIRNMLRYITALLKVRTCNVPSLLKLPMRQQFGPEVRHWSVQHPVPTLRSTPLRE